MYRSLARRKADEAARRRRAPELLRGALEAFAKSSGGRYVVYGSLARGDARFDSDVDLLVEFPTELEAEAWRRAEEACAELGIEADIRPIGWCRKSFLDKALRVTQVIS